MTEPHNTGLDQSRQVADDVADVLAKALKSWDDGLKLRRSSLAKDYLNGDIYIHVHLLIRQMVGAVGNGGPLPILRPIQT